MYATSNVSFTTSAGQQEIMTNPAVQAKIQERLGGITQEQYNNLLNNGGIEMEFTIFFSGANSVSVNGGSYNPAIENAVYSSGDYVYVNSIMINNATTALLSFNIK